MQIIKDIKYEYYKSKFHKAYQELPYHSDELVNYYADCAAYCLLHNKIGGLPNNSIDNILKNYINSSAFSLDTYQYAYIVYCYYHLEDLGDNFYYNHALELLYNLAYSFQYCKSILPLVDFSLKKLKYLISPKSPTAMRYIGGFVLNSFDKEKFIDYLALCGISLAD